MTPKIVLIVDDNEKNLKLIRDILHFKGFGTLEATNGESAVEMALQNKPALILMDIQLPGIDGRAAMKIIKEGEGMRDIPVVALTALAMRGTREVLVNEGFDDYISKPVNIKEVLALVQKYLG